MQQLIQHLPSGLSVIRFPRMLIGRFSSQASSQMEEGPNGNTALFTFGTTRRPVSVNASQTHQLPDQFAMQMHISSRRYCHARHSGTLLSRNTHTKDHLRSNMAGLVWYGMDSTSTADGPQPPLLLVIEGCYFQGDHSPPFAAVTHCFALFCTYIPVRHAIQTDDPDQFSTGSWIPFPPMAENDGP